MASFKDGQFPASATGVVSTYGTTYSPLGTDGVGNPSKQALTGMSGIGSLTLKSPHQSGSDTTSSDASTAQWAPSQPLRGAPKGQRQAANVASKLLNLAGGPGGAGGIAGMVRGGARG